MDATTNCVLPRYRVVRDEAACTGCAQCVRSCANLRRLAGLGGGHVVALHDEGHAALDGAHVLMDDIAKQAQTGGVLLSSMGTPAPYPIYWDHLLLNASQVTNPSIDPLREGRGACRPRPR